MSAQTRTSFKGVVQTPETPNSKEQKKPKKDGQMYPIEWPPYDTSDVKSRIDNVLGPLSLFAPFPHEDANLSIPSSSNFQEYLLRENGKVFCGHMCMTKREPESHDLGLERPNTPIDKEIRAQPSSFEMLSQYIRRRIAPKPGVLYLSFEDQQNLAGIIMGEVNGIWSDIRKQIDDPFLSAVENKELNRRIAVHIVTVCEKLFHHYLQKAEVLNSRGVFSGPANMSRLKVQLALETNNFLNILRIRRYIVADMRTKVEVAPSEPEDFVTPSDSGTLTQRFSELSYQGLIQTSRPKSKLRKYKPRNVEEEIKEMTSNMPNLDTSNLMDLVADLPDRILQTPSEDGFAFPSRISEKESRMSDISKEESSKIKVILKRSSSEPVLHFGETLLEELEISTDVRDDPMLENELIVLMRERQGMLKEDSPDDYIMKPGTREYAAEDLKRLVMQTEEMPIKKVDEDLPPLLQAIMRNAKHDNLKERMEKQMKELEEKEKERIEKESITIREPTHPQPATVCSKMTDKLVVRTSDTRVSERVCMSSITLNQYPTVYNDLIEEIDPATVKDLDKNLFLSDEIREVYKEIMKTVSTAHMNLDNDDMIQPSPEDMQLSGTAASSTLSRKRNEWVINPNLNGNQNPPWGSDDVKQWVHTPTNPPKNFQGEDVFPPMMKAAVITAINQLTSTPDPTKKSSQFCNTENIPSCVAEKMARNYSSWLHWWKSTVNSDDYMKYISTQESDFLGVLFHFYDSDVDDDDEDGEDAEKDYSMKSRSYLTKPSLTGTPSTKTTERSKEAERKLQELKAVKYEYTEGFWNVNSVLMGGLGNDPQLEEEDSGKKPEAMIEMPSAMTLMERAAQARQSKLDLVKSRDTSRTSRRTLTTLSVGDKSPEVDIKEDKPKILTPQERLEKIWSNLQMPDSEKLNMAVKYSCDQFYAMLTEAMDKWESVANLILQREGYLEKLEHFERKASDPNRFFEKGVKGSSVLRLQEARRRSSYYKAIDILDNEIRHQLGLLQEQFKDKVTYKGRLYVEKMKWDRIEMLYWLQEERKEHAMKYERFKQTLTLKCQHLDSQAVINTSL